MDILQWAKEHPWMAGALTLGAIFVLLWLLGFFGSSSSSSTSSNSNNLAAAYYSAEAAQTTAGTQLQMATEAYGAQTAQDQIQANAATAIASTQANMYTTIGQQNTGASTTINAQNTAAEQAYYNDQLLATENSNNDAAATAATEANFNYNATVAQANAGIMSSYISSVLPQAISYTGGAAAFDLPGVGGQTMMGSVNTQGLANINDLVAQGYTLAQAQYLTGVSGV